MTPSPRVIAARIAAGLGVSLLLVALGLGARTLLTEETAQAHLRVHEGERALVANDRANAVLEFERARLFAPRAEFVRAALLSAGAVDAEPILQRTFRLITVAEWSALATAFGWLGGLALAVVIARKRAGRIGVVALATGGMFALSMAALVSSGDSSLSVITGRDATALVAPYPGAAAEGPLPPGSLVLLEAKHGGFVRVRRGDGLEGWVPLSSLSSIGGPAS